MRNLAIVIASVIVAGSAQAQDVHMDKARRVLEGTPLFDGHNDLPWVIRGREDAPRDVGAYDLRGPFENECGADSGSPSGLGSAKPRETDR